jgi:RHS repeat-associated protein
VTQTNATDAVRFGFAGMEYDSVTGLYYDHARYYDAVIGRFVSQDPKGFAAGDTDLYRYVGNSPTTQVDTDGLGPIGNIGDLIAPGTVKFGNKFSPSGGPWYNQDPLASGPVQGAMPAPGWGYYSPTDGLWTPGGYLKIPFNTTVYVIGSTPDGRPVFYTDGTVTWYPAGTQTPFYNDNPSSPQVEGPASSPAPVQIGPNWPWTRLSQIKFSSSLVRVNKYP